MSGHITQKYIFKIHTDRLVRSKWDLTLPLSEARRNEEIISIGDSQMLRWIDELTGRKDPGEEIARIRQEIRRIRKLPHSAACARRLKALYEELDKVQLVPDYLHLVIDKNKHLLRACKGFKVNGMSYVRLVGTAGGVKNSTIVFVNEALAGTLRARIDNGRDQSVPWIPAKLEAYRALTCSGSMPVSDPHGILLVKDCETLFNEDVIVLNDEEGDEPNMKFVKNFPVALDESDGYGLMLPSLAKRWSEELGLDYVMSGANTRYSFEKGMVFTFDFAEFADKVAHSFEVKDAWGVTRDIRDYELVLTTSQVKLWKCYKSMEEYLERCKENHYQFGIPKMCPRKLEDRRGTNYQFIQSFDLDDDQIDELIRPTINEIKDVLSGDYRKAILFLRGVGMTDENADVSSEFGVASALMVEPKVFGDSYVRKSIYHMIKGRIGDAKIGVLSVHGNYSIVCGDPYALCQSMFALPVTGLLKKGEIYSKYWSDCGASELACFRAPMSTHENIAKVRPVATEEMQHWYQYMTTCTLFNAWDSACARLNGMDKDGDLVMLTDNKVLVDNIRDEPTIFCAQRSGEKKVVTEDDLVQSNIAGFGDDIGRITNYVTSMYEVQARFDKESEEYKVLAYRIRCGQQAQQNKSI